MPWISNNDGSAQWFDWDDPKFKLLVEIGVPYCGTLLGAIQREGVRASAFKHALRSVPVYDATAALAAFPGPLPAPIGTVADYRVIYANGVTYYHGVHPADLKEKAA